MSVSRHNMGEFEMYTSSILKHATCASLGTLGCCSSLFSSAENRSSEEIIFSVVTLSMARAVFSFRNEEQLEELAATEDRRARCLVRAQD